MESLFLEDFTKYKYLSNLNLSPDAGLAAFISSKANLEENTYQTEINIIDNSNNNIRKLASSTSQNNLIWKDNENIIFSKDTLEDKERREKGEPFTSFYRFNIRDEEEIPLFEVAFDIKEIKIVDEENFVFLAKFDPRFENFSELESQDKEDFLEGLKDEKDYKVLDEIPFWANGEGFTNKKRNKLYLYNVKNQKALSITDDFTDVYSFELDIARENILLITNSFIDKKYNFTHLQVYNIEKESLIKISPFTDFDYSYANFLGDNIIFSGSDMKAFGLNQNPAFYLSDLDGFKAKKISPNSFNFSTVNSIASDCRYGKNSTNHVDSNFLYFVTTEGDSSFINRIDEKGKIEKLTNKKGSIDGFDVKDGYIQFIGLRSLRLQEVYGLKEKKEIQITNFNQWVLEIGRASCRERV